MQASVSDSEESGLSTIRTDIYQAGIDTLFNVDTLRQVQEYSLSEVLRNAAKTCPDAALSCLPRIFQSFLEVINKHRNTLFSQGSNRGPGASLEQARTAGLRFFASCNSVLDDVPDTEHVWRTRAVLLGTVEERQLLGSNDDAGTGFLSAIAEKAYELLVSPTIGTCPLLWCLYSYLIRTFISDTRSAVADATLSTVVAIIRIDYEQVVPVLPRVLQVMVTVSTSNTLQTSLMVSRPSRDRCQRSYLVSFSTM